jgi:AhpD family alkylhydroperoxidase
MTEALTPVDITTTFPDAYKAASAWSRAAGKAATEADIPRDVVELIDVRVSQINGCARCLSVHVPKARKAGVTQFKLDQLPTWRETEEFTTNLPVGAALVAAAGPATRAGLSEEQLAAVVWVAIAIGAFNRISMMSGHAALPPREESD